jgi:molybdenum cofactor biosynthesis protein B
MSAHLEDKREYEVSSVDCWVITVSDSRDETTDTTGRFIRERLESSGHRVAFYAIIKNDAAQIAAMVEKLKSDSAAAVAIFHGGTGLSQKDQTARTLRKLFDEEIDGFGEIFRMLSFQEIGGYALLSRATAGVMQGKLVFSLPGSENAVQLAMEELILPVMGHAVQQLQK